MRASSWAVRRRRRSQVLHAQVLLVVVLAVGLEGTLGHIADQQRGVLRAKEAGPVSSLIELAIGAMLTKLGSGALALPSSFDT